MPKLSGVVRIPILRRLKAERRIYAAWNTRLVRRVALKLLQVSDGSKHLLYSKAYRGESRTLMNTYGHLIDHSVEAAVQNITDDAGLMKLLATGQTP